MQLEDMTRTYTIQSSADGAYSAPRGQRVLFALLEDYCHGAHCVPAGLHAGRCILRGPCAGNIRSHTS